MLKSKVEIRSIIFLLISVAVVIPGAFVYRYFPDILYRISITAIDQQNTLKSLMAVYLGFHSYGILVFLNRRITMSP